MPFFENAYTSGLLNTSLTDIHHQYNYQTTVYMTEEQALAALKPAVRGGYEVPVCMEGTRESVFREIDAWLDDTGTPNIMWIGGTPGAGKSTVASTLVSNLTRRRRLGSFYFFKRGDAVLSNPATLWRTVAFDLAQCDPGVKDGVLEFLSRPGFRDADIGLHFDCMIKEPLTRNFDKLSSAPPVVIIDALDECGSDDSQSAQRRILLDTLNRWTHLPRSFKLVVTSRNERLPSSFYDRKVCRRITLETGISVNPETRKDIRTFFEKSFDDVRRDLGMASTWPGNPAISRLTDRAAGLFIWAKTAMAFMEEKWGKPAEKLTLLLAGDLGKRSNNIDTLYRQILDFSFKNVEDTTFELFRAVVGTIIVAKTPLHRGDLKHFLGRLDDEDDWQFSVILRSLSSVVESDGLLRLRHLSFAEFLTNPKRCSDHRFIIDRNELHHNLALSCLRIMKTELKFNICELETSHVRNNDVVGLPKRITTMIPTRLQYSCRFWAAHLCDTTTEQKRYESLLKEVKDFFHVRLLYWLEVMSLIKEVSASLIAVLIVAQSQAIKDVDQGLSNFARDASRFIVNFHTPISESAPHIYLSALPFSPQKSMISRQFSAQCPGTLSVVMGRDDHWPPLVNILTGHMDVVVSVAYSPDGKHVVSGSPDKTVRVWNVETGQIVAGPFEGHTDIVRSVAYSPDGKHVVSGSSDMTVRVWDVETGHIAGDPFEGHVNAVWSVAYSPDGKRIVSGSFDRTVRVWDAETGQIVAGPFEGHTDVVWSVAYSLDGKRVVSSSSDNTVRVWDVETGQIVSGPCEGHTDVVWSVAYSPDGKHVTSGSSDKTVRVWDVETGQIVAGPFEGHTGVIWSVAYSPDGKRVVSSSSDNTVRVWDAETGRIVAGPFEGHTDIVWAVACSPDGKHVVSGSNDKTLRLWDVETGQAVASPPEDVIWAVSYSPDGRRIVSGSCNKTVRLWDIETGQFAASSFAGHIGDIASVAYSPDGKRVVSGSDDKTVRVWDVETGQTVAGPFEGHTDYVWSVSCSRDGKRIVSGSNDRTVRVWDVETGQTIAGPFEGHTDVVWSVAYSPDGKRVVSASSDKTVRAWDVETGHTGPGPFEGHTDVVWLVVYSPDGKRVASGSSDKTVRVWDVETGQTVAGPFEGHTDVVWSVAYSPDGKRIVSGSSDKTVRLWDIETGQVVAGPFKGHTDVIWSVGYSPDGKRVVSGSHDKTLRLWDVETSQSLPAASNRHIITLRSMGGPNAFCTSHENSNGWTCTSSLDNRSIFFWVPPHARQGLCDGNTLLILGERNTRLDLSQFKHGTSWTHCHPCPFTDISTSAQLPITDVNFHPCPPTPWYHFLLRHVSFILIPLIAIYFFYLTYN